MLNGQNTKTSTICKGVVYHLYCVVFILAGSLLCCWMMDRSTESLQNFSATKLTEDHTDVTGFIKILISKTGIKP